MTLDFPVAITLLAVVDHDVNGHRWVRCSHFPKRSHQQHLEERCGWPPGRAAAATSDASSESACALLCRSAFGMPRDRRLSADHRGWLLPRARPPWPIHSMLPDASRVAQKKPSVLLVSHIFASIRRRFHCTRTMANSNPMGRSPPAAFAIKTIRLHRVGHSHFSSMSMMRSIRASIPGAFGGTTSYSSPVTARKEVSTLRIGPIGLTAFARQLAAHGSRGFSCSSTALVRAAWNPIGSRVSWCTFAAPAVVFSSIQPGAPRCLLHA